MPHAYTVLIKIDNLPENSLILSQIILIINRVKLSYMLITHNHISTSKEQNMYNIYQLSITALTFQKLNRSNNFHSKKKKGIWSKNSEIE
jgi:hypothetical protein